MGKISTKALLFNFTCIICFGVMSNVTAFAQKTDSVNYMSRSRKISKTPSIRINTPAYRPIIDGFGSIPYNSTLLGKGTSSKPEKNLTFLKVFPNPVDDQISVVFKLERESLVSIKIMDLLGNEVATLANERASSGEQTKTYTIANRLSSGIYFVRIVAGAETSVKRISIL
ncbi:MAG: hypothetical protein JWQ28_1609 [Pedobacter sp.]|jgi:hypothetical protein|nr:hypothetical protein [Pedobacter sp.]